MQDRKSLLCSICKKKDGACIQCEFKRCTVSFHVRCAAKSGVIRNPNDMQGQAISTRGEEDTVDSAYVFCKRHVQPGRELIAKGRIEDLVQTRSQTSAEKAREKKSKNAGNSQGSVLHESSGRQRFMSIRTLI